MNVLPLYTITAGYKITFALLLPWGSLRPRSFDDLLFKLTENQSLISCIAVLPTGSVILYYILDDHLCNEL